MEAAVVTRFELDRWTVFSVFSDLIDDFVISSDYWQTLPRDSFQSWFIPSSRSFLNQKIFDFYSCQVKWVLGNELKVMLLFLTYCHICFLLFLLSYIQFATFPGGCTITSFPLSTPGPDTCLATPTRSPVITTFEACRPNRTLTHLVSVCPDKVWKLAHGHPNSAFQSAHKKITKIGACARKTSDWMQFQEASTRCLPIFKVERRVLPKILLPHILIPLLSSGHVILRTPSSLYTVCIILSYSHLPAWVLFFFQLWQMYMDRLFSSVSSLIQWDEKSNLL